LSYPYGMTRFDLLALTPRRFKTAVAAGVAFALIAFPNTGRALFMGEAHEAAAQTISEFRQILDPILARARHREMLSKQAVREQ
jgi:hypothetical protein